MAEIAVGKRIRINKIRQQMLLATLGASLVVGFCLVLSMYLIKYIAFNTKVIAAKDESINNYYSAIKNVGICEDKNKDKKYTDKELEKCDPEGIDVASIPGTLRYNTMVTMAGNNDLESVGREALKECYAADGVKRDFYKGYREAKNDEERIYQLNLMRMCSALRAIPDAIPAKENQEALLASLNQILLHSKIDPEALTPGTSGEQSPVPGLGVTPVSLTVDEKAAKTQLALQNIEKSIRVFDITTATINWSDNGIELQAQALAYYAQPQKVTETTKTIYASEKYRNSKKSNKSSEGATKK